MKETIRYAWGTSSLGDFIAAASAGGVVALEFGKREGSLTSALESRLPETELVADPTALKEIVEKAANLIEHPAAGASLPVDLRGYGFERQVWCALQEVPAGKTISYGELASRLRVTGLAQEVGEKLAPPTRSRW